MIEKLLQHSNIGSKSQIIYVIELLSKGSHSVKDLRIACVSKEYSFSNSFDGIICLLQWLDIINISNVVKLHNNIKSKTFIEDICLLLFSKLAEEKKLHNFINSNNLIFNKTVYIKNSLIKLQFSPIRNLLINLEVFEKDNLIYNQFVINKQFLKWFIYNVIPLIENSNINDNSIEDFKKQQQRQEKLGIEAEKFILNYEKLKRRKNPNYNNIQIISEIDVKAGYDIKSYKYDTSIILDKFIEVKSYKGEIPYFYWSINEIKVAKQEKDNYFLYLVNRDEINNHNYQPTIIQNPYKNVFQNNLWDKKCQKWIFNNI